LTQPEIAERYTQEEAAAQIEALLQPSVPECKVIFYSNRVQILSSCHVRSRARRMEVCRILAHCGVTQRSAEDLSAEWVFHNIFWDLRLFRGATRDVDLDYRGDSRLPVRMGTALLRIFRIL